MARLQNTEQGKAGTVVVVVLLFAAMGAAVAYLLADINSRLYRVSVAGSTLVVEKGRKLPWGFSPYVPKTADLLAAYAPIPVPAGEAPPAGEVFEDRTDIDRSLFGLMAGWAKARLGSAKADETLLARTYIERARILPGLSEEQRRELARLTADLALGEGRRLLAELEAKLVDAGAQFKRAQELGASDPAEARRLSREVERMLEAFRNPPPDTPAEAPAEVPSESPAQPKPPVMP